jgi:Protein of unknown function (DUF1257).
MSHISIVDTKIQNLTYLKKALASLNMQFTEASEEQRLTVCGYGKGEDIEGCLMEIKTGSKYGIGIRQQEGKYEFVADWWAIETFTGQKQEDLLNKLTRQYAYETVMDKVKNMGYSVVQENEDAKQNVRITVRRWK